MEDYYQILDISPTATDKDVKTAYKRLALQWHPDKNPNNPEEASQKFKKIAEAYQILGNTQSRRDYDYQLKYGGVSSNSGFQSDRNPNCSHSSSRNYSQESNDFFTFSFRSPEEIFAEFFGVDPFQDLFQDEFNPFFGFGFGGPSIHNHNAQHIQESEMDGNGHGHHGFGINLNFDFPLGQTFHSVISSAPTQITREHARERDRDREREPSVSTKRSRTRKPSKSVINSRNGSSSGSSRSSTVKCSSTTTRIINGKRTTVEKTLENNVETTTVYEDDVLTSRTVRNVDPSTRTSVKQQHLKF